jgi:outer membrane protein assembly factor BamE
MCFTVPGIIERNGADCKTADVSRHGQAKGEMKVEMFPKSLMNRWESRRMRGTLIAAAMMSVLAGCSTYDSITQRFAQHITPYRITVVQGNFVSQEAANQMKVGMTRDQVKTLLGTPLLADMFHADRWDYIFYFKRGSTSVVQQRDFVVNFANDHVASWKGGENLPSNLELLAEIDGDKGHKFAAVPVPAAPSVAGSDAAGTPPVSSVTAPAGGQPSTQPNAANALAGDANQQAAAAANRATDAVQAPTGRTRSSALSNAPTASNFPPTAPSSTNSQLQFSRKPDVAPVQNTPAIGPPGTSPSAPANTSGQATFYVPQPGQSN